MPTMSWSRDSTVSLILGACRDVLIYLAGPLSSEAERRLNLELTHSLGAKGFDYDTRATDETPLRLLAEEGSGVEAEGE